MDAVQSALNLFYVFLFNIADLDLHQDPVHFAAVSSSGLCTTKR